MNRVASTKRQQTPFAQPARETAAPSLETASLDLAHALLHANSSSYQHLLDRIESPRQAPETSKTIDGVAAAAVFACSFHTGRFADGALENLLLEIGRAKESVASSVHERERASRAPLRILHVATHVLGVGGHTRMLHRWIAEDHGNRHSVALTRQGCDVIPAWLLEEVESTGGQILTLGEFASDCERASRLRSAAYGFADLVVVHHSGADVIPTLAFAADGGPPVAILNHADHGFWLGSSVADLCIDLRSITNDYSVSRRYIPETIVLPIPLPAPVEGLDRIATRQELGIGIDVVMLLTVARAVKFRPCGGQNFMATVETVLNEDQNIHLYVIGETMEGMTQQLRRPLHPRIHCVGPIENPGRYRAASDVYIESFPFGSNTSLLEAALDGLPVVPACRPLTKLLVACNDSLLDIMTNPANEAEYCERIRAFTRDPDGRQAFGRRLRHELLRHHVGAAWKAHLQGVYQAAARLVHRPRPIPVTTCESTPCDIGLGLFNALSNGRSRSGDPLTKLAALRHSAFVAKDVRDFRVARALSFSALRIDVLGLETWRLFLISLLGPFARAARDILRRDRKAD